MKVTIVQNGDNNATVHRAGCADIKRREMTHRAYLSSWDADVATEQAAAGEAWSDFIGESMTEADALGYTRFLPCTAGLPSQDDEARRLGTEHGTAGTVPYGDLESTGSADLMTALGEHDDTSDENQDRRTRLLITYRDAWTAAAGRGYSWPPRPE